MKAVARVGQIRAERRSVDLLTTSPQEPRRYFAACGFCSQHAAGKACREYVGDRRQGQYVTKTHDHAAMAALRAAWLQVRGEQRRGTPWVSM